MKKIPPNKLRNQMGLMGKGGIGLSGQRAFKFRA